MEKVLFQETQRFNQIWIWVLLMSLLGLSIWGIVQQAVMGIPFGNNPGSDGMLYITFAIMGGLVWLFGTLKLKTTITPQAVTVSFSPFYTRVIPIANIHKAYIREYRPLMEYGGWGYRIGGKGTAFNVRGNVGLQLELTNGQKILIGTQQREVLEKVIYELF